MYKKSKEILSEILHFRLNPINTKPQSAVGATGAPLVARRLLHVGFMLVHWWQISATSGSAVG